mgnify:FL=1
MGLGVGVGSAIVRMSHRECSFQFAVFRCEVGIIPQSVAKTDHSVPGFPSSRDHMDEVRPWIALTENLVAGYTCPCGVLVSVVRAFGADRGVG